MNGEYTQANFNKLPALVPRAVFLEWTGWRSQDLSTAVKDGEVKACRRRGHRLLYYKTELARITNLSL